LPLWREKKVKILGLVNAQRLSLAPELPTVAETFPGYDLGIWQSIVASCGHISRGRKQTAWIDQESLGSMSLVVVRSDGPKTIKELVAKAKANPGKLNMGAGTIPSRLGALQFAKAAGIDVQLVPFKGSAEIGQAVLAGTVDFALDSSGTSLPLIQSGHYRAL